MQYNPNNMKYTGIYRGKVLDNSDSEKLGRIKVEVVGIFSGITSAYLPWAVPGLPLFCGAGSGFGWFGVPAVGSWVWCFFEEGDYQQPVYFSEAPDGIHGFPTDDGYPDSRGFVTPGGHSFVLDDNGDITIVHSGGAKATLSPTSAKLSMGDSSVEVEAADVVVTGGTGKMIVTPAVTGVGYLNIDAAGILHVSPISFDLTQAFDPGLGSLFISS